MNDQEKTIQKLNNKRGRTRDLPNDYAIVNSRNRKDKNYASLTPNRTITSLDSMSSAGRDMDSILNGLVDDTRKPSKRDGSKHSRQGRKSRKSKHRHKESRHRSNNEGHDIKKRKRSYEMPNYDETISKDSECSPGLFRHRNFKLK